MIKFFSKKYFKIFVVSLLLVSLSFQFIPPPQKARAEAPYKFPAFCHPKIPFYNVPRGESEEFYQACYMLKDIYDAAYNQVSVADKIGKYTDPFGQYSPLNQCSSCCYLGPPGFECTIDVWDLACLIYPPLCTAAVVKLIADINQIMEWVRIGTAVVELYTAAQETIEDFSEFFQTLSDTWNSLQALLAAAGDIDLSQIQSFSQDLIDFAASQQETNEKIFEVETRFQAMIKQVESYLALPGFGFTQEQIRNVFDDNLRNSLDSFSKNEFYHKFLNMKDYIFQTEYFLSTSTYPDLDPARRAELLARIYRMESYSQKVVSLMESFLTFPEKQRAQSLKYLSYLKEKGVAEMLENLKLIENEIAVFPLDSIPDMEKRTEIEERFNKAWQIISQTKPSIEILVSKIEEIEAISGKDIEDLARKVEEYVQLIKENISSQIFGYSSYSIKRALLGVSTPQTSIWEDLKTINSSNFSARINAIDNLADSLQTWCCQNSKNCCNAAKALKITADKILSNYPGIHDLLYNRFEKEQPEKPALWLKYLSQLKPQITDFLININTLETQVQNFPIPHSDLNSLQARINQIKPPVKSVVERITNIETITGMEIDQVSNLYSFAGEIQQTFPFEMFGSLSSAADYITATSSQPSCWQGEEIADCQSCGELNSVISQTYSNAASTKELIDQELIGPQKPAEELINFLQNQLQPEISSLIADLELVATTVDNFIVPQEMTSDCQTQIQNQLTSISGIVGLVKPVLEEMVINISNIEEISKAQLLEVAKLYAVLEKLERIIQNLEEIKEEVGKTGPTLDTTEAELRKEYQQIRNDLNRLKTLEGQKSCNFPDVLKYDAQNACHDWCWPSQGKIPTHYSTHAFYTVWTAYGKASFSNCAFWGSFQRWFTNPVKPDGSVVCVCQDADYLPQQLSFYGLAGNYLTGTINKIDEVIASTYPLEESAIKAMKVINALIAILEIQDVINGIKNLKELYKKLTGECVSCEKNETCPAAKDPCGYSNQVCKEGEKCKTGSIKRVIDAWNKLFSGEDTGDTGIDVEDMPKPADSHCKLTGKFEDLCKELASRGVYGEKSSRLILDLNPLRKQTSENYGMIKSSLKKIADLRATLANTGQDELAGKIKNTVELKAERIWEKSLWLNIFINVLNISAEKSFCGKSGCREIFCIPAIFDLVGIDCDWEICKVLGGQIDDKKEKCNVSGINFWQGKNNNTCEIPPIDVFNHADNWMAWILSWLIAKEGGFIDVLEQEIKD